MIVVILKGGLGNQMFQYALGLSLARKYSVPLVLDTTYLNDRTPRKNFTFRKYELNSFNINPKFTLLSRLSFILPIPLLWLSLSQFKARSLSVIGIRQYVRQVGNKLDLSVLDFGGNLTLEGYFQSEQYFENFKEDILRAFSFKNDASQNTNSLIQKITNEESVCLHVRRGDYVAFKNVATEMGILGIDYYTRAISVIKREKNISRIYIFSDDIPWCRSSLNFGDIPVTYEDEISISRQDGFRVMSAFRYFVIGNSTYSWWAAWIGSMRSSSRGGVVVAPSIWAEGGNTNTNDILPKSWIRV